MGLALCTSTLVPDIYRGKDNLGNCLIALELANRTGASVLAIMQSMVPIHGKPSWSSAFLIATVNTCGRFTPLRFKFQGEEGTDAWGCRAFAKDKESGDELVGSLITIGLAKSEGWYGKNGSKWKTMPEQMLTYRAAAFWTRAYAPEVSLGMHTAEEARDMVDVTPESERPAQKRTRPAEPITPTVEAVVVTPEPAAVVTPTATAPVQPEPAPTPKLEEPPEPALADRKAAFESVLTASGFTEENFWAVVDAHPEWEFKTDAINIGEFNEAEIKWVSRKWKTAILPALKGGAK
jgi:hypothetical protein